MSINVKRRVYVYWNLHRHCWSVRQSAKVVAHLGCIALDRCRFLVAEQGRKRVLNEGRKNVHAGVSGYPTHVGFGQSGRFFTSLHGGDVTPKQDLRPDCFTRVLYNPRRWPTFVRQVGEQPIHSSDCVLMESSHSRPIVFAHTKD